MDLIDIAIAKGMVNNSGGSGSSSSGGSSSGGESPLVIELNFSNFVRTENNWWCSAPVDSTTMQNPMNTIFIMHMDNETHSAVEEALDSGVAKHNIGQYPRYRKVYLDDIDDIVFWVWGWGSQDYISSDGNVAYAYWPGIIEDENGNLITDNSICTIFY